MDIYQYIPLCKNVNFSLLIRCVIPNNYNNAGLTPATNAANDPNDPKIFGQNEFYDFNLSKYCV